MNGENTLKRLEERVRKLEAALERRSSDLRRVQQLLGPDELAIASRMLTSLEAMPGAEMYYRLDWWNTRTSFVPRDVEPVLRSLWASSPRRPVDEGIEH